MSAAHGTARCYLLGCRCAPCRYGYSRARRASRPLGDPVAVQAHIRMLSAAGIGYRRAAELAGVTWQTVWKILYDGRRPTAATAERILAVQPSAGPAEWLAPPTGVARRLQALRAAGWPNVLIAERAGVTETATSALALQRRRALPETAAAIGVVYAELADSRPPATVSARRNRTYGRQRCWFPPGAWDADTLDDPDALPCLLPPVEPVARDLELLVQHVFAGHPVEATTAARREIVRRMPDRKPREIAPIARCTNREVHYIRSTMEAS